MDDTSRDPAITEDEIRALQFSVGDVAEIEQTILSFVDACHTRKVAMVVGSTINTLKDRDGKRWGNLPDIYCAGNDSNLLIVFYVQIMPDDFVMQLHRF
ncbi:hypothetical protein M8H45_003193 [Escherichia coli]|nr:hypothetical protein [Escherichia coli]